MKMVIAESEYPYFPKSKENHPVVSIRSNEDWYKHLDRKENVVEVYLLLPLKKENDDATKLLADINFADKQTDKERLDFVKVSLNRIRKEMETYPHEFWEIQWPDFLSIGTVAFCKQIIDLLREEFKDTDVIITLFDDGDTEVSIF